MRHGKSIQPIVKNGEGIMRFGKEFEIVKNYKFLTWIANNPIFHTLRAAKISEVQKSQDESGQTPGDRSSFFGFIPILRGTM